MKLERHTRDALISSLTNTMYVKIVVCNALPVEVYVTIGIVFPLVHTTNSKTLSRKVNFTE